MSHLIPILIAYTLAAISPGPSVILVMESASFGPRRLARILALGVSLGSFVWVVAVTFGLGALLRSNPGLTVVLRYASAALLSYFLIKTVIAVAQPRRAAATGAGFVLLPPRQTFLKGFLVNLLNPSALAFFLSLFAPMLTESQAISELSLLVTSVTAISLIWYQSLVTLVSHPRVQPFLLSGERWFRLAFAGLYLYFLIRLLVRA